jgi:hypothetical protein
VIVPIEGKHGNALGVFDVDERRNVVHGADAAN